MEMIELKSIITEIKKKKSLEGLNNRFELAEGIIKLEDIGIEIT